MVQRDEYENTVAVSFLNGINGIKGIDAQCKVYAAYQGDPLD
jgi:hypothetical protein